MPTILLLSGPIASGKTTLADELIARHGFKRLKSSDYLKLLCQRRGHEISRLMLQQSGDRLDEETDYRWLVDDVACPQIAADPKQQRWLIDSVRKERQIFHFRSVFGSDVLHVHASAPDVVLKERFEHRLTSGQHHEGATTYAEATSHPNEISARALATIADVSINLSEFDPNRAATLIVDRILGGS
jgi:hypothetical protein